MKLKKFLVFVHCWAVFNVSHAILLRDQQNVRRPALDACKLYSQLQNDRIVGDSQVAQRGEFPWMAALGVVNLHENYDVTFVCGGTIISDYFVMTAAHCLSANRLPNLLRLGKLKLNDSSDDDMQAENYYIKDAITHPNYSVRTKQNDIGLVRTAKRIEFTPNIKPACLNLDVRDEQPSTTLIVTGWGVTSRKMISKGSNILLKANLKTFPLTECSAKFLKYNKQANVAAFHNGLSEGQYCAYDPTPLSDGATRTDSCQGDSGGPLQYISPGSPVATVVGIVSSGVDCGTDLPGLYTRVAFYLDWIEAIVWPKSRSQATLIQGKNYNFETIFKASWFKAYLHCKSNGRRLASITSKEENDKIVNQIRDAGHQNDEFWTSGIRVDRRDFYWAGNGQKFEYTNWCRSNPDNLLGDQYCVRLWGQVNLEWDDTECYREKYFVCEDGVDSFGSMSTNAVRTMNQWKRYSLVTHEANWFQAFISCKSHDKQLVSITSRSENEAITRLIRESGYHRSDFWTSGVLVDREDFYWMSNETKFGYSNWSVYNGVANPDNLHGNQLCVQLWGKVDLKWDDTECYRRKYFVCEE